MSMDPKVLTDGIPGIEQLPQRAATEVTNEWDQTVREVRERSIVSVTEHDQATMVLMDAETYRKIFEFVKEIHRAREESLAEISVDFDRRLASFESEGIHDKVADVMAQHGHSKNRPKAGSTY